MRSSRRLAAIMFTDIVAYTAMMQSDKNAAMNVAKRHEGVLKLTVSRYNGEVQNFMGDGSLCLFDAATDAVACARDIQLVLQDEVPLRIGIHVGEVTIEDGRAYGDGVNIASRIESTGHAGTVLFSQSIHDKIKNDTAFSTESLGDFQFKNVAKPMEVFALAGDGLVSVDTKLLKNRIVSKWGNYFKILKGIGALAFIATGALVVNALMGTTGIPDKVKGGRLAIAIYDNQTGDKELDIIGNYISDGLYRGFDMLGDVKLSSPQVVKENHEYLGVLPGNERKKPSFYELTGARFTIEGSYYALGQDSVEFKTFVVDKISGETIYSFDPVKGSVHSNEHLLEDMQSHILGYWATREAVDKYNIHPPKFEAYQEYVKGNHKIGIDPEGATIHYLRAIEIDPDFTVAYSSLSMQYSAKGDFQKGDSIISILEVRSDNLTNRERYGLELYSAIKEGNFHKFFQLRYELYLNDPNHFDVNFHAGLAANRCNYAENAIEIFRKIDDSEINYSMLPYWFQWRLGSMAIAYNKMGQYQKTIDLIDRFLPINSNYPGAIVSQIQAYANLGLDGKIEQFASMRKGSTRMNQFRVNCEAAVNYYILFNQKMVMKFTERALHESELDSIPPSTLAEIFFMRREFGKAKEICLDMIEQDTADVHWKTLLAVMEAHLLDQNPAFLEDFLIQINQNGLTNSRNNNWPSNVIPYASAIIYAQRGEKEKAMDYIHQSFESGVYFFYDRYDWDIFLRPLFDYPPFQEFVKPRRYVE